MSIRQWNRTFANNQHWVFDAVPSTSDTYSIRSVSSGKVISVNSYAAGAPVTQWTNQGAAAQQWVECYDEGHGRPYYFNQVLQPAHSRVYSPISMTWV